MPAARAPEPTKLAGVDRNRRHDVFKQTMYSFLYIGPSQWQAECMPYESNVRQYRERLGLSQEKLARELDVSRQTIVNIERGESEPRVLLALALAAVLGVAVSELFRKGASFR